MEQDLISMYRKNDPEAGMYTFLTEACKSVASRAFPLLTFHVMLARVQTSRSIITGSRSSTSFRAHGTAVARLRTRQ